MKCECKGGPHGGYTCPACRGASVMTGRDDSADERAWLQIEFSDDVDVRRGAAQHLRRLLAEARAESEERAEAGVLMKRVADQAIDKLAAAEAALAEAHRKLDEVRAYHDEIHPECVEHDERFGTSPCKLRLALASSRSAAPEADDEQATCVHGETEPHSHEVPRIYESDPGWYVVCPGPVSSAEPGGTT